jgi:hypothetical protein
VAQREAWWLKGRRGGSKGGVVAQWEAWWLKGRRGGSKGGVVAQREAWWLKGRRGGSIGRLGGSMGGVVAQREMWRLNREAWWLNGSATDYCPAVPGSNPASSQPTADCQSSGGLPPGIALGCRLTSVRGNRGENYEN